MSINDELHNFLRDDVKVNDLGGRCNIYVGEIINASKLLVGYLECNRPFGRPWFRWKYNISEGEVSSVHTMKAQKASSGTAPPSINDTSWLLHPCERNPRKHRIRGWVGPDELEKRKIPCSFRI
jgi:hypothetical protein